MTVTSPQSVDISFGMGFDPNKGFFIVGNLHVEGAKEEPKPTAVPLTENKPNAVGQGGCTPAVPFPAATPPIETPAPTTTPAKPMTADEKKALEAVLSAKRGEKVTVTKDTHVSEEVLYAAAVYRKLPKKDQAAFIKELKESVAHKKNETFFQKTERALKDLVKKKKISSEDYTNLKRYALGKAQLDSTKTDVTSTRQKLGEGVGSALERFRENRAASVKDLQAAGHSMTTPSTTGSIASSNGSPSVTGGGFSQGFLWKPQSDSDGKLAILLPANLTGNVAGVSVVTPDGKRVSGRYANVGNGGREHYRFDRSGGAFPSGSAVVIEYRDGRQEKILITNPGARLEKK